MLDDETDNNDYVGEDGQGEGNPKYRRQVEHLVEEGDRLHFGGGSVFEEVELKREGLFVDLSRSAGEVMVSRLRWGLSNRMAFSRDLQLNRKSRKF